MSREADPDPDPEGGPGAAFAEGDRLSALLVDDGPAGEPEEIDLQNERRVAIYDILEANRFALADAQAGPYALRLRRERSALVFEVSRAADQQVVAAPSLRLSAVRPLVQDYAAVCNDYRDAITRLAPSQIEALDAERRAVHDEASEALRAALAPEIRVDGPTARRLFTLICAVGG